MLRAAAKSGADAVERLLGALSPADLDFILHDWPLYARPDQRLPAPTAKTAKGLVWRYWAILAGRGWGKTRTGAEAVREMIDTGRARNVALVGATRTDTAKIMVEGKREFPALMGIWPESQRPVFIPSRRLVRFHTGATGTLFSGEQPERLRGPQHDLAWVDELPAFKYAEDTWDNLLLGNRHGEARTIITTTPKRGHKLLKSILADPLTFKTAGRTEDNRANLSEEFWQSITARYAGTTLGRQELDGEMLEEVEGALLTLAAIQAGRLPAGSDLSLRRVVVAVDPSGSGKPEADECGIVVSGAGFDRHKYTLEDGTLRASPKVWAARAVKLFHKWDADAIVAEANFGGEMVKEVIEGADPRIKVELVTVSRGKHIRAEPVAAEHDRGYIHHVGIFPELEEEWTTYVPGQGMRSPNRLDADVMGKHWLGEPAAGLNIRNL